MYGGAASACQSGEGRQRQRVRRIVKAVPSCPERLWFCIRMPSTKVREQAVRLKNAVGWLCGVGVCRCVGGVCGRGVGVWG